MEWDEKTLLKLIVNIGKEKERITTLNSLYLSTTNTQLHYMNTHTYTQSLTHPTRQEIKEN